MTAAIAASVSPASGTVYTTSYTLTASVSGSVPHSVIDIYFTLYDGHLNSVIGNTGLYSFVLDGFGAGTFNLTSPFNVAIPGGAYIVANALQPNLVSPHSTTFAVNGVIDAAGLSIGLFWLNGGTFLFNESPLQYTYALESLNVPFAVSVAGGAGKFIGPVSTFTAAGSTLPTAHQTVATSTAAGVFGAAAATALTPPTAYTANYTPSALASFSGVAYFSDNTHIAMSNTLGLWSATNPSTAKMTALALTAVISAPAVAIVLRDTAAGRDQLLLKAQPQLGDSAAGSEALAVVQKPTVVFRVGGRRGPAFGGGAPGSVSYHP